MPFFSRKGALEGRGEGREGEESGEWLSSAKRESGRGCRREVYTGRKGKGERRLLFFT